MYKVLLFDDRPQVRFSLASLCERYGMTVLSCKSVYEADDIWEECFGEIDAIVLDMMIPSQGLTSEERILTNGALFTGWIWFWHHLNPSRESRHPAADKCVVIYSGYLDEFIDYTKTSAASDEQEFLKSVLLIPKGKEDDMIKCLLSDYQNKKSH